ncbi:YlxM family DNA-binding protein [Oscillospiraceae bacterium OttesenSCG-928-G22]|nr:YlxM family DNA-binding protein [Oscillospiraceae bacterium OttesenSCG-928-G22]
MKTKAIKMVLLFDFYGNILTEKQREFFDLYYNEDLSLAEIAENEGITRQGVRDAIVRAENTITEMEEKLGLFQRYGGIGQELSKIAAHAHEISNINRNNFLNKEIDEHTRAIVEITEDIRETL